MEQTEDGGYIIAGYKAASISSGDVYIIKSDSAGNEIWSQTYDGDLDDLDDWDEGQSIKQTSDGGYIIVGRTYSFDSGSMDLWLIKVDELGDIIWDETYGESPIDWGYSVEQTEDGGYVMAGFTGTFFGSIDRDFYVIKTDSTGCVDGFNC